MINQIFTNKFKREYIVSYPALQSNGLLAPGSVPT